MAVAGLDIYSFIEGAKAGISEYSNPDLDTNEAYKYAVIRYIEKQKEKKSVEFLVTYEPHFVALAEWWKQLFGESEGKEKKGLVPASLCFTTDLHSMGQYIQEGERMLMETVITFDKPQQEYIIGTDLSIYEEGMTVLCGNDVGRLSCRLGSHDMNPKATAKQYLSEFILESVAESLVIHCLSSCA